VESLTAVNLTVQHIVMKVESSPKEIVAEPFDAERVAAISQVNKFMRFRGEASALARMSREVPILDRELHLGKVE